MKYMCVCVYIYIQMCMYAPSTRTYSEGTWAMDAPKPTNTLDGSTFHRHPNSSAEQEGATWSRSV